MKATINGITVEGTPEEISRLLNMQKEHNKEVEQRNSVRNIGCTNDCYDPKTGEWLGSI